MRAVGPNVVVRNIPREKKRASGLTIPGSAGDKKLSRGIILSVGSLVNKDLGGDTLQPGMVIFYDKYSATEIKGDLTTDDIVPVRGVYGIDEGAEESTFTAESAETEPGSDAVLLKG